MNDAHIDTEQPGLLRLTMYRCGCGSQSTVPGPCMNLSYGAHDGVDERHYSEAVEYVAGADLAALADWGSKAWETVDELRGSTIDLDRHHELIAERIAECDRISAERDRLKALALRQKESLDGWHDTVGELQAERDRLRTAYEALLQGINSFHLHDDVYYLNDAEAVAREALSGADPVSHDGRGDAPVTDPSRPAQESSHPQQEDGNDG